MRLIKLLKAAKKKNQPEKMKIKNSSVAWERIFIFVLVCIITIHTAGCIWIFIHNEMVPKSEDDEPVETWITYNSFDELDDLDLYTTAIYFTITTFTTVGYGDISARNFYERIIGCVAMVIGVISFSYATGAASSLIHTDDNRKAIAQHKIMTLQRLNENVKMDPHLMREIQAFISFSNFAEKEDNDQLIQSLPERLRNRLTVYMF